MAKVSPQQKILGQLKELTGKSQDYFVATENINKFEKDLYSNAADATFSTISECLLGADEDDQAGIKDRISRIGMTKNLIKQLKLGKEEEGALIKAANVVEKTLNQMLAVKKEKLAKSVAAIKKLGGSVFSSLDDLVGQDPLFATVFGGADLVAKKLRSRRERLTAQKEAKEADLKNIYKGLMRDGKTKPPKTAPKGAPRPSPLGGDYDLPRGGPSSSRGNSPVFHEPSGFYPAFGSPSAGMLSGDAAAPLKSMDEHLLTIATMVRDIPKISRNVEALLLYAKENDIRKEDAEFDALEATLEQTKAVQRQTDVLRETIQNSFGGGKRGSRGGGGSGGSSPNESDDDGKGWFGTVKDWTRNILAGTGIIGVLSKTLGRKPPVSVPPQKGGRVPPGRAPNRGRPQLPTKPGMPKPSGVGGWGALGVVARRLFTALSLLDSGLGGYQGYQDAGQMGNSTTAATIAGILSAGEEGGFGEALYGAAKGASSGGAIGTGIGAGIGALFGGVGAGPGAAAGGTIGVGVGGVLGGISGFFGRNKTANYLDAFAENLSDFGTLWYEKLKFAGKETVNELYGISQAFLKSVDYLEDKMLAAVGGTWDMGNYLLGNGEELSDLRKRLNGRRYNLSLDMMQRDKNREDVAQTRHRLFDEISTLDDREQQRYDLRDEFFRPLGGSIYEPAPTRQELSRKSRYSALAATNTQDMKRALRFALNQEGITDEAAIANIFAQVEAESQWVPREEKPSKYASSRSKYKGRGLIQLSTRKNYERMTEELRERGYKVDLVRRPELANDPELAVRIAAIFYKHQLSKTQMRDISAVNRATNYHAGTNDGYAAGSMLGGNDLYRQDLAKKFYESPEGLLSQPDVEAIFENMSYNDMNRSSRSQAGSPTIVYLDARSNNSSVVEGAGKRETPKKTGSGLPLGSALPASLVYT